MKYAEFVKAGEMKIVDKPMPKIKKLTTLSLKYFGLAFVVQICGHTVV